MKLVRTWVSAYKVKLGRNQERQKRRRGREDAEKVPPSCVFVEM